MIYQYSVGGFLPKEKLLLGKEGCYFDFADSGAELIYFFSNPSAAEVQKFRAGESLFRVFITSGIVFFLSKFGNMAWSDSPFNRSLSKGLTKLDWPEVGEGYGLLCIMANAVNGEILVLRQIGLPTEFSRELREVIRQQPDIPNYKERLALAFRMYTTAEMVQKAQIK